MAVPTKEEIEQLKKLDLEKFSSIPFVHAEEMLRILSELIPKYIALAGDYDKLHKAKNMESKSPEKLMEFQRLLDREKEYVVIVSEAWKLFKDHFDKKNKILTDMKIPKIPAYILEEFLEEEKPKIPMYIMEELPKSEASTFPWYKRLFKWF